MNLPPQKQKSQSNNFRAVMTKPKAWLFILAFVFIQIILPGLACYLMFSGLPWMNGAAGVVVTIVIFGLYFIGFFILQLKGQSYIVEYLRKK